MSHKIIINGKQLNLTNLDKVYCQKNNITKKDCLNYYIKIYPYISEYLKNRPVALTRYPNGFQQKGFYQKNVPEGKPSWVETINIPGIKNYPLINNIETFLWLCNLGTIEFHPWLSNKDNLDFPDYGVLDIDPMEKFSFKEVLIVARKVYEILELLKIKSYPKLTGSTGIQIYIPLVNRYTYEEVREFIRLIYVIVNNQLPEISTLERKVEQRKGKIYLDYLQNVKGQTLVAPYSIRPKVGAPISMPVRWEDIYKDNLSPQEYNIFNSIQDIETIYPYFLEVLEKKQKIEKAYNLLQKLF
ncbi:non-homologous end-joining DNA ligase [Anaerobranca gottschalkii]|uniref:Bifunctional non-homologous end joining protein LigD n=1 Tax=Anaerobranca gottschalkii DSM 13577 TaxID=1120990 RepID=A0A1I0BB86_9FIRM|nr:non-homologous end-joining DNA ligase [Anaerobranca gottschalkii]SET04079.1 bifunctional non-homologous end joining protein LigD [Anaerobranca gottschalkii DSM 13577]